MDQQGNDRDLRQEIERGLYRVFGEFLSGYSIKNETRFRPTLMLGPGGIQALPLKEEYTLTVNVAISLAELMKKTGRNDTSFTRLLSIGDYAPTGVNQYQDLSRATYVIRVNYRINDVNHFIDALNEKAWQSYEQDFTSALEDTLNDPDRA